MQVNLITHTPEPEKILMDAFSQCYQKPANLNVIKKHLKHQSVLEHISFTFEIKVSRVCWEQLVRHRMASYTAQSHRYTDVQPEDCSWYTPTEITTKHQEEWENDTKTIYAIYKKWRDRGVSRQTARYLINKGVAIQAMTTMNLRSLLHFFSLRLDAPAQEEIKLLAKSMYKLTMEKLPDIKETLDEIIIKESEYLDKKALNEVFL